jgi:hypothetical protein
MINAILFLSHDWTKKSIWKIGVVERREVEQEREGDDPRDAGALFDLKDEHVPSLAACVRLASVERVNHGFDSIHGSVSLGSSASEESVWTPDAETVLSESFGLDPVSNLSVSLARSSNNASDSLKHARHSGHCWSLFTDERHMASRHGSVLESLGGRWWRA